MPAFAKCRREWGVLAVAALLALPLFTPRLYASDEIKFFAPLRSFWIDGDLHYANEYDYFIQQDPERYEWLIHYRDEISPTGRRLNDGPIGSALLWAPFYIAADLLVIVSRAAGATVPRDGFSAPYVRAICVASLFWGMVGLMLIYRTCRLYFGRWSSTAATLGLWFASPIVFYLYITPPMAHANSLFSAALFLFLWQRQLDGRTVGGWALLGAAGGLMILVRELNWLLLMPVVVRELTVLAGSPFLELWSRWRTGLAAYGAFAATLAVVVAPQLLVYRMLHGTYGPAPYVVNKFALFPRHDLEVLFSGFHGLFSWTPITLLGVLGLLLLATGARSIRSARVLAIGLALAFVLQVLVIGSFATWWGGASFGARRFINCTPIFTVGLAAVLDYLPTKRRRIATLVLVVLVAWNFGLALQYATGIIPRDQPVRMTTIVRNQLVEVPPRLMSVARRFLTERSTLYQSSVSTQ